MVKPHDFRAKQKVKILTGMRQGCEGIILTIRNSLSRKMYRVHALRKVKYTVKSGQDNHWFYADDLEPID